MTADDIAVLAGQVTAVGGALVLLWRYCLGPLIVLLRTLRRNSELIAHGLPLLDEWLRRWPDLSGPRSFFEVFAVSERRALGTEALLDGVIDLNTLPVYLCSTDGECVMANRAICELFGLSRAEMMGRGWLAGIAPDDRARTWQRWQESISARIPYETSYLVRNQRTGQRWSITTVAVPIIDANGAVAGYYGKFPQVEEAPPEEKRPAARDILRVRAVRGGKLEIGLDCGHEFETEDMERTRAWLRSNTTMRCPDCERTLTR